MLVLGLIIDSIKELTEEVSMLHQNISQQVRAAWSMIELPTDPAALFSEGGEVMKLHIEGSLMIPKPGIKRV